jgi:hypothetical protein
MRIAYVNNDEVNQDLVARKAAQHGAFVLRLAPQGLPPDGLYDAVLYNLDDVPRHERYPLLERLRHGKPHRPTAVHGYDITEEVVQTLKQSGVVAARRLHRGLLRDLFAAAQEGRASLEEDDAGTELTWVNLAK